MLHFQFSPCPALKNKKQSEYSFSLFEVHIILGFKSESFLIYYTDMQSIALPCPQSKVGQGRAGQGRAGQGKKKNCESSSGHDRATKSAL